MVVSVLGIQGIRRCYEFFGFGFVGGLSCLMGREVGGGRQLIG